MKKISKKFLVIVLMILTAGSITFGSVSVGQNIKLTNEVHTLQEEKQELETNLITCRTENEEYEIRIGELEEENSTLTSKNSSLEKQVTELKKK